MTETQSEYVTVKFLRAVDTLGAPPSAIPDKYANTVELQMSSLHKMTHGDLQRAQRSEGYNGGKEVR